ncbi:hypothetical protein [Mesorhizobium sp. M6A.T.Cr.TU.016.01.1.1]|uniref:hypothetical protein n=1 Tax=Mesorhizobium sp. M6A.T.Cr.TU.016.01.1.1 TaxID=2493677 RepID=UPI000F76431F|nr:hypothetical protein [Mesorhizobium sp. M6A.T.Cr.TU.016.01.1.1]AZO67673.1 hypothetical protein EJ075_23955 [Mesorhizobium sp. M6A.T.Cr.TU.016.01.1.1]
MQTPTFKRAVRVWDDGSKSFVSRFIEITIDLQSVADALAPKAIKNKSKQSKLVAGAIVGKLV